MTDFEQFGAWRRGNEANGTFTQSAERAHSGQFSAKLAYSFATVGNDYVVFMRNIPLGGRLAALTAWVYGDGTGPDLNAWVKDAGGEVWSFTFGKMTHVGWQQVVAPLDIGQPWPVGYVSGPNKGTLDYPLTLTALVLDDAPDTFFGAGAIYIDDLSCSESVPVVAGSGAGLSDQPFGPIVFSSAFDATTGRPLNAARSFPAGTLQLYAVWPYHGVAPGTPFQYEWYVNGTFWFRGEDIFKGDAGNAWASAYMPDGTALPAATYTIVVKVGGLPVLTDQADVSNPGESGGPPPPPIVSGAAGQCQLTLLDPSNQSSFGEGTQNVTLRWQLNRPLGPNEYFFVNVPFPHGGTTWYDGTWRDPAQQLPAGIRDTQLILRDYLCLPSFSDTGWYQWYVEVRQQLGASPSQSDPVMCKSETRSFNWSGCQPTPEPTDTPEGASLLDGPS